MKNIDINEHKFNWDELETFFDNVSWSGKFSTRDMIEFALLKGCTCSHCLIGISDYLIKEMGIKHYQIEQVILSKEYNRDDFDQQRDVENYFKKFYYEEVK